EHSPAAKRRPEVTGRLGGLPRASRRNWQPEKVRTCACLPAGCRTCGPPPIPSEALRSAPRKGTNESGWVPQIENALRHSPNDTDCGRMFLARARTGTQRQARGADPRHLAGWHVGGDWASQVLESLELTSPEAACQIPPFFGTLAGRPRGP